MMVENPAEKYGLSTSLGEWTRKKCAVICMICDAEELWSKMSWDIHCPMSGKDGASML